MTKQTDAEASKGKITKLLSKEKKLQDPFRCDSLAHQTEAIQ